MGRKRPWNEVNTPVYSLLTFDAEGLANMNICTYVTPVSLQPKSFLLSLFLPSKSRENMALGRTIWLQYLTQEHLSFIRPLGKKSAKEFSKWSYLEKKSALFFWKQIPLLKGIYAAVELKPTSCLGVQGDHELWLGEALSYKHFSDHQLLSTRDLIEKNLIL